MSIKTSEVVTFILEIARVIEENKQMLSDLDAAIGDGDHGHNMARGFEAVAKKLAETPPATVGEAFKTSGMTLVSNVGGASGPLYGTLFLRAGVSAQNINVLDLTGFISSLRAGITGVQARGKAEIGEKTMLDVLIPVLASLEKDSEAGVSCRDAFKNAAALAQKRAEKTKDIVATKGRAAYLGERSIGHIDPGAMSSCLMIQTISKLLV
ncbi:dihydroxyacetone kinase subunit L [Spirochaetia bacterium]|nr:dihydroxyacetone kinase subunit L [Spirochaetia bacterium]